MNPCLQAALEYADMGWSVIPINPNSKKALAKWKGYIEKRATPEQIKAWWARWPKATVGVITGKVSNLVVVDIDPHRGGLADEWQRRQPSPIRVTTRRGGTHFYYAHPGDSEVHNSVDKLGAGIDVRAEGGYVVAPPSRGYSWQLDDSGLGSPTDLPKYRSEGQPEREVSHEEPSKERWLEKILKGVGYGERNDACARLAGYYFSKKMPPDVVVQQLLNWNRLNDPPLTEQEIRITAGSVERTAAARPSGVRLFELDEPDGTGSAVKSDYEVVSFGQYMSSHGNSSVSWMVKDWLPEQTVGMVVAPPGSYKTWLLQDLAVSVATGLPFLGQFPVLKKGPVLFMQQEDWHGQTAARFSLIVGRRAGLERPTMEKTSLTVSIPPRVPIYLHEHRKFSFGNEAVINAWIEQIKTIRPALVILDPLYSAGKVEDFMAGTARDMFLFKSIRDALGTTFLIAHHTRKASRENGKEQGPAREDAWGSQFLNAWLETGWQVRRKEELGKATVLRHFKAAGEAAQTTLGFNIDTTQNPGKYEVSVQDDKPGEKHDEAADLVRLLEVHGSLTPTKLVALTGLHRATVFRRMGNLEKAGVVEKSADGYSLKGDFNA